MKARILWAGLWVLAFGLIRWPFERRLEAERHAAFHSATLNLGLRRKIGQAGFVAALSGFRAVVADGLYIYACTSLFERTDWPSMKLQFDAVTALQPRCLLFWQTASWHMAFNASVSVLRDVKKQPREALRLKAEREYWKLGEEYLLQGIANNPESSVLWETLGSLYRLKFADHCRASEAFAKSATLPGARAYVERFAAYELAACPGHERAAYERLLELYQRGDKEHLPTLLKTLGELQEKLHIPPEQKVITSPPNP